MAIDSRDNFLWGPDANRIIEMEDDIGRLLASDGWKRLQEIGTVQCDHRKELLLSYKPRPDGPSDDFLKGAIFGIRLILDTPAYIMEQARELHEARAEEINE